MSAILLLPAQAAAEHRVAIEPSVEIVQVHDDNLNFSSDQAMRDRIRRVTPTLALRFESPRFTARAAYGLDREDYSTQSALDNDRARDRATIGIQYGAAPRLTLSLESSHLNTNTLADLNVETGLGAGRVRARQFSISPSARFLVSPRTTATASALSTNTNVENGTGTETQTQKIAVQRRVSQRDLFTVDYQHSQFVFDDLEATHSIKTHTVLAGWSRGLGPRTHVMLQAGPRFTDGSVEGDLSAALTHNWRSSSMAISILRSQTAVIGTVGVVETESVQARFNWAPNRRMTAYAAPALMRSTQRDLEGTVYRLGLGAHYAITPLVGLDVGYSRDEQNGALDPLHADDEFSRSTLSIAFTTRWNSADKFATGRAR